MRNLCCISRPTVSSGAANAQPAAARVPARGKIVAVDDVFAIAQAVVTPVGGRAVYGGP